MIRRLLHWFASRHPASRIIQDREGKDPYLSRWYLREHRRGKGIAAFLHKFHRGDDDQELHCHPWVWSIAVILSGGYVEERRVARSVRCSCGAVRIRRVRGVNVAKFERQHAGHGRMLVKYRVISRIVRPGTINFIRGSDFHRVDLLGDESWSLFIAGPQTGEGWGFWNRMTSEFTPWREFITRKRGPGWKES